MKSPAQRSSNALYTAQILGSITAVAAAWLLTPRPKRARQTVIITGGSRGLGLALAGRFGRTGDRLVLTARNSEELDRARQLLLERGAVRSAEDILLVPADLTDPAQAQHLVDQTISHFGRIDVLINCAGIIQVGPFENQPLEAFRQCMETNFFTALHTIQAALPFMLSQDPKNGRRGSIVNISSIGGKIPVPHLLPYVASKFALTGFSEGLHAELRGKGVRVTTVCPGLMRTGSPVQAEFTGNSEEEFKWFAFGATNPLTSTSAEHAANRIYRATRSGRAEIIITPQAWLAAHIHGLWPTSTQVIAGLANQYILPAPTGNSGNFTRGAHLKTDPAPSQLEQAHNQA